jgi:hypothetical protein
MRAAARWPLLVAATVATWVPIAWLYALVAQPAPHRLVHAEFAPVAAATPPAEAAPWEPVALPDDWRRRRPGVREGWYRFRLAPAADAAARALYLPTVTFNAAAWLDGMPVGSGGPFEDPLARNANRPLLFPLPAAAPGAETLHRASPPTSSTRRSCPRRPSVPSPTSRPSATGPTSSGARSCGC